MCGRFSQIPIQLTAAIARSAHWLDKYPEIGPDLPPRYNLAPTQRAGVVLTDDGDAQVRRLR